MEAVRDTHPPLPLNKTTTQKISLLLLSLQQIDMSRSSSPIYIPSCSASPELAYPNIGNTPFPPVSPTPFTGNVPIPPMNTHTSTPDSTLNYV